MEIWVPVLSYEGIYEVSNFGRIKSLKRPHPHVNHTLKEVILKNQKHTKGYMQIYLCNCNKKQKFFIHRLVAVHFLPTPGEDQIFVNHKDKDRTNNHVDNLEWTTHLENMYHRDNYDPDKPF